MTLQAKQLQIVSQFRKSTWIFLSSTDSSFCFLYPPLSLCFKLICFLHGGTCLLILNLNHFTYALDAINYQPQAYLTINLHMLLLPLVRVSPEWHNLQLQLISLALWHTLQLIECHTCSHLHIHLKKWQLKIKVTHTTRCTGNRKTQFNSLTHIYLWNFRFYARKVFAM